jgi:hypothetical protein
MNRRLKIIGIICIATAIMILIANLFYVNDISAAVGFDVAAVGYILISVGKSREENKLRNEKYISDYEISELIYSYCQMGKYIKDKDIPELEDIQVRIENELNDIEIRVKNREEWINKKGI